MELPDDVLQIIREYSKPVTRPDWRTLHKMTQRHYNDEYYSQFFSRLSVLHRCRHDRYNYLVAHYKPVFAHLFSHLFDYENGRYKSYGCCTSEYCSYYYPTCPSFFILMRKSLRDQLTTVS